MFRVYWHALADAFPSVSKFLAAFWVGGEALALLATFFAQIPETPQIIKEVAAMDESTTWKTFSLCAVAAIVYLYRQSRADRDKHFESLKQQNETTVVALQTVTRVVEDFSERVEALVIPALQQAFQPKDSATETKTQTAKKK